ncbi:MAG: hypothetical protein AAF625_08855 [Pseudomonadota bacterium]
MEPLAHYKGGDARDPYIIGVDLLGGLLPTACPATGSAMNACGASLARFSS